MAEMAGSTITDALAVTAGLIASCRRRRGRHWQTRRYKMMPCIARPPYEISSGRACCWAVIGDAVHDDGMWCVAVLFCILSASQPSSKAIHSEVNRHLGRAAVADDQQPISKFYRK